MMSRSVFVLFLCCLSSSTTLAFQKSVPMLRTKASTASTIGIRSNVVSSSSLQMSLPVFAMPMKVALAVPIMYASMSVSEYITHRYYQHTDFNRNPIMQALANLFTANKGFKVKGGGHVEHHAETLDDMSLKNDERWIKSPAAKALDSDKYRGTAFTWSVTIIMFVQLWMTCSPFMSFLGWSSKGTVGWVIPSLLAHTLVWNALHPAMHGLPDPNIFEGPPGFLLASFRNSKLFKWLELNHVGHHFVGGLGNYNVCCPGFDHVMGTYVPFNEWKTKVANRFAHIYDASIPPPPTTKTSPLSCELTLSTTPVFEYPALEELVVA